MSIHTIREKATPQQITDMLQVFSQTRMIKIVVDIEKKVLAGGSGMHFECEQLLLNDGCQQENLWGANWYVDDQEIEFESLINIRPRQNRNIVIQDPEIQRAVEKITREYLEGVKS
jgi:hypothetical protein